MSIMLYEYRLFGPRKGQTMTINGHQFIDGWARLQQSTEKAGICMRVLSFYGAYARGTPDYNKAMDAEEAANGAGEADTKAVEGADTPVRSNVRPDGPGPATPAAVEGNGNAESGGASGSGGDTNGDGHGHAGVPKFPEGKDRRDIEPPSEVNDAIRTAVKKLDPENGDHWVATGADKGKPKLKAVEEAHGRAGLTRQDVEAALPDWNRDTALAAALAA